jgi:hypothetical protein
MGDYEPFFKAFPGFSKGWRALERAQTAAPAACRTGTTHLKRNNLPEKLGRGMDALFKSRGIRHGLGHLGRGRPRRSLRNFHL